MRNKLLLKREMLRSIGIFVITMAMTSLIVATLKDYYWLMVLIPAITVLIYLGAIFFWITKTERGKLAEKIAEEMEEQPLIKNYRNVCIGLNMAVGSLILLLFILLLYEYNFTWLIAIPTLSLSCIIGLYLLTSSFGNVKGAIERKVEKEITKRITIQVFISTTLLILFIVLYRAFLSMPVIEFFVIFAFLFAYGLSIHPSEKKMEKDLYNYMRGSTV